MKIIDQSWDFDGCPISGGILQAIERAGRTCYKSEERITDQSASAFVRGIIASGHESVLEHVSITVRIITDRGVSHELVRHRLASYSQESTRFCNYSKDKFDNELTFIRPVWVKLAVMDLMFFTTDPEQEATCNWHRACLQSEKDYLALLGWGWSPQQARMVLNNSLKTEIAMTANLREWRLVFKQRCSPKAHPQMQDLAQSMLRGFRANIAVVFDDIYPEIK